MIKCSDDCHPICDFCIYYKDDGTGLFNERSQIGKHFEGEGLCIKKNTRVDACGMCKDDFHCFNVEK